ncbi:MAG: phosphoribosylanthranilate isomerase [Desulfobulbaceae bacterium]|nr:phosphoribosylanthranilate isomerase [Desulfobulbaceae bacterium]
MRPVRVKICGITRLGDALCAAEAGVDALGFIFHPKSPRNIVPASAKEIIAQLPPFVAAVGVFVNAGIDEAVAVIQECGLDYAQLHGEETPAYCQALRAAVPACKLIKALRVGGPEDITGSETGPADYASHVRAFLLDTYAPAAHGGTGTVFDWQLIGRLQLTKPFILAGGLHPGNVQTALEVSDAYGVDANSGLEDAPGIKNHALIRQFVGQVRELS